jgi:hypothetical protein
VEGTPFDMSGSSREVRIPFEFEASQVVQDQDRWAARFQLRVTWERVSVDDRQLRAYIREDEEAVPDWI